MNEDGDAPTQPTGDALGAEKGGGEKGMLSGGMPTAVDGPQGLPVIGRLVRENRAR